MAAKYDVFLVCESKNMENRVFLIVPEKKVEAGSFKTDFKTKFA